MLVMLLGQTRVLYSMANDGLLPKKFFAAIHPKFRTPWKNTILVGLLAAIVGSVTPIDDIGKMVNIGTLLAFVIVSIAVMVLRRTNPSQPRPFRTPWVPLVPILGVLFERIHDVQAGLGELGAIGHLAGDRTCRLFHLRTKTQSSAGDCRRSKTGRLMANADFRALRTARRAVLFYSRCEYVVDPTTNDRNESLSESADDWRASSPGDGHRDFRLSLHRPLVVV